MKMKNEEVFANIAKQKFITENQILLIKHRVQKLYFENKVEAVDEFYDFMNTAKNTFQITETQETKGFDYLKKKYLTRFGYLRNNKSIKFKYEILYIIQNMKRNHTKFYFSGFAKISNGIMTFIEPVYKLETYIDGIKKSFYYYHYGETDYEFNFALINKNLKGNDILYLEGHI